jgi:ribosomal protein S12 methylthiotransferase
MTLQQDISLFRNEEQVGRVLPVLVEGSGAQVSIGRSYRDAPEVDGVMLLPGDMPVGKFVAVRVLAAQPYDLVADPVE